MWNDGLVTEYLVDVSMDIYGKMDIGLILVGDVCKGGAHLLTGAGQPYYIIHITSTGET
jgi:hypothetical protein